MLIVLFLVSHYNFLSVPHSGLSWLPVSFLLHVKYTLSYRIVSYRRDSSVVCRIWECALCMCPLSSGCEAGYSNHYGYERRDVGDQHAGGAGSVVRPRRVPSSVRCSYCSRYVQLADGRRSAACRTSHRYSVISVTIRYALYLTLHGHIKTAEKRTVIHQYGDLLVHWPLMGGLLHLAQRGGPWAGWGPAKSPPRCTNRNSPPING